MSTTSRLDALRRDLARVEAIRAQLDAAECTDVMIYRGVTVGDVADEMFVRCGQIERALEAELGGDERNTLKP